MGERGKRENKKDKKRKWREKERVRERARERKKESEERKERKMREGWSMTTSSFKRWLTMGVTWWKKWV